MNVQVLVATMNREKGDYSLLEKMNIQTDAIVCNQCDRYEFEQFEWNGHTIRWLSFKERGVGLNRNNALMRATGEIILFADDDMRYVDGYEALAVRAFENTAEADVVLFNIGDPLGKRKQNKKVHKVGRLNYLRYGTARIGVKLSSVKVSGIYFNQCFGGGTEYSHGEDNLFLSNCLDKGLQLYSSIYVIANLTEERNSTWDNNCVTKYIKDQGVLYRQISRRYWRLLCLQDAIRRSRNYGYPWYKTYVLMTKKSGE